MGKSKYIQQRRNVEKLLEINKQLSINEICVKLNLNKKVSADATQLISMYRKYSRDKDLNHPQYIAIAIYFSCKSNKTKVKKTDLLEIGQLKSPQWTILEQEWSKWLHNNDVLESVVSKNASVEINEGKYHIEFILVIYS